MPALFSASRESCYTHNPPSWLFPNITDVKQLMCLCEKKNFAGSAIRFLLSVMIELVPSY